jgi:cytidylate kinase
MAAKYASNPFIQLADRQARLWSQLQAKPEMRAPAVAFSRLPGAGGEEVGRLVAEKLGYGFFAREILDHVAKELDVDHWLLRGLDERVRTSIERMISDLFSRHSVREDTYLRALTRTISTLGQREGVVIVGRGAPFILPPDRALRVLLVAPRAMRIERYAEAKKFPPEQAEKELARAEQSRSEFAEWHFGLRQEDPVLYDLVLNTGTLGFDAAADLVVQALGLRFPGSDCSGEERGQRA